MIKNKKKYRALVVGSMVNREQRIWSEATKAYDSVKAVVAALGTENSYFVNLADELRVPQEKLLTYLEKHDSVREMRALIKVLVVRPDIAIKPFVKFRDAQSFITLLEQMDYEDPGEDYTVDMPLDWYFTQEHHYGSSL